MRPTSVALAATALVALMLAPLAAAQSRCVTYYVAAPAAPFTYKAGFDNAKWPKDCDPEGIK